MIEIKNIIEDIVFDFVDNLDESKSGEIDKNQKREISAFVLNRVKPMYITSNKGFTNVIVKYQNDPQFIADIMMQISQALKVVQKSNIPDFSIETLNLEKPHYVFPKVYGKLISSRDLLPISDAEVTLLIDGVPATSLSANWQNPAIVLPRDEGIFSFAPKPMEAKPPYERKSFLIEILVSRGDKESRKNLQYETAPVLINKTEINFHENVLQLEDLYISF